MLMRSGQCAMVFPVPGSVRSVTVLVFLSVFPSVPSSLCSIAA